MNVKYLQYLRRIKKVCYNVQYIEKRGEKYAERYKTILPPHWDIELFPKELPVYYFVSAFSHPILPIVKHDGISLYEWGLIPFWVKDILAAKEISNKTLNAMGETVFEKPSFRKCIASQRGLLGVNGFYEWRDFNKKKYPYLIQTKSDEIFSLGCIYETWVDYSSGEIKNTFSILTTAANPFMEKIHNIKKRMPLIISREDEAQWIDENLIKEQIIELIKPYPESDMTAHTITQGANYQHKNRNIPEILKKIEYPELKDDSFL